MINIENVDHVGIRVTDARRSLSTEILGFELQKKLIWIRVIVKNPHDVEINLIVNGADLRGCYAYGRSENVRLYPLGVGVDSKLRRSRPLRE